MSKTALITGITGQDAAYLAKFLLSKDYKVIGIGRTLSTYKLWRLQDLGIIDQVELISGDITDTHFIFETIKKFQPDECYNFAAVSFVGQSWSAPELTLEINTQGVLNILDAIKNFSPSTKLYQAGSSEMFGAPGSTPQTEETPFMPCNPYGVSKLTGYHLGRMYRQAYNLFVCNGICYNHESPLRGSEYVTKKISESVAKIKLGLAKELRLGNIDQKRDWGYAKEYIEAMWSMLQQETSDDYIVATGELHSIKDFLQIAFTYVGIKDWEQYVVQDEKFYRPLEPALLCGNAAKAKEKLSWSPKTSFKELVEMMVETDLKRLS
jgi:GDPmannose 4,6-dehydratase